MPRWEKERGGLDIFELEDRPNGGCETRTGRVDATGVQMQPWQPLKRGLSLSYRRSVDRVIQQREAIGYRRVDDVPLGTARDPALEAAILEDPDDDERRKVYADWLLAHGDARGEWANAELAGDRFIAARCESQAVRRLRTELGHAEHASFEHRLGLLHCATVAPQSLTRLDGHPLASVLDHLRVGISAGVSTTSKEWSTLIGRTMPPLPIRRLTIERLEEDLPMSWVHLDGLERAWPKLPRLRHLTVESGALGCLSLPPLETLEIRSTGLAATIFALATRPSPTLRSLVLWFGSEAHADAEPPLAQLRAFLADPPELASLTTLGLCNLDYIRGGTPEFFAALAASPLLPQLQRLDLSHSGFLDDDIEAFLDCGAPLQHLELDLSDCLLSPAGVARAAGLAKRVIVDQQRENYDNERYASVTE